MSKQKKLTFYIIEWFDAVEPNPDEVTSTEESLGVLTVYSAGYAVEETRDYVTIARDFCQGDEFVQSAVRRRLTIPKSVVNKIYKLELNAKGVRLRGFKIRNS